MDPNIDPTTARAGRFTPDEDNKLKDAVQRHGGKDWDAIAALVPGRTRKQCSSRWHDALLLNTDETAEGRRGIELGGGDSMKDKWVQTCGGEK